MGKKKGADGKGPGKGSGGGAGKDAGKSAGRTAKLPKELFGVKLPKELRRQGEAWIERAQSPAGQQAIASALTAAPTIGCPPSSVATAIPGSIPCGIASARNVRPRTRTHDPATAHSTAARTPASSARCVAPVAKGSVNQYMALEHNDSRFQQDGGVMTW